MTRPTRNALLLLATVLCAAWVAEGEASAQPTFHIVNRNTGRCLGVEGASMDANAWVNQYNCDTGAGQLWSFVDLGNFTPRIQNVNSGMCLDIPDESTSNGARLQQYPCHPGTTGLNQQFSFTLVGRWFSIVARHSNKCIAGGTGSGEGLNGALVEQWTCSGASLSRELWVLVPRT